MKKTLIVIDMQNDFIDGALGTEESRSIIKNVNNKIVKYISAGDEVIFTRDTHDDNYLQSNEGQHLPIIHCVRNTDGWQIPKDIDVVNCTHINKATFGYKSWFNYSFEEVEIVGLCTDVCVISNALILKSEFPEINITVDASCCAGVTPESHKAALTVMKMCHINVIGE